MANDICCSLFRGKVYLQKEGTGNPLLEVGNVTSFEVTHDLTEVEQENYQTLGGRSCYLQYINSANLSATLGCLRVKNLALALQGEGSYENIAAGSITDEPHTVNAEGELIDFERVPDRTGTIVVTDDTGVTTYVAGTDYQVVGSGIVILEGTTIPLGSDILVDYDYGANSLITALTSGQGTYKVVFDGVNFGEDGQRPVVFKAFRVRFSPTETLSLIGDEFATLEVTGEILIDSSRTSDTAQSQYYEVEFGKLNA
jgi:hypothetical protein